MTKSWLVGIVLCFVLASCSKQPLPTAPATPQKLRIQEGYPAAVIQSLSAQQTALRSQTAGSFGHFQSVVSNSRTWRPGEPITIAFQGGSPTLRKEIVDALHSWTDAANLTFDWGATSAGQFREWTNNDAKYAAEIRIAFRSGKEGGYWSLVGQDSLNPSLVEANQPSMNFEGFTQELPPDWAATVLHEFGHALGFEHEHQSPVGPCEQEFRWDNDPGYVTTNDIYGQVTIDANGRRPGIYALLEGPPNNWEKSQIDFNLRQLPNSADWRLSAFDSKSIMKYYFDAWMFANGTASQCYSNQNLALSPEDLRAIAEIYPRGAQQVTASRIEQTKALRELSKTEGLPQELKSHYTQMLQMRIK